MTTVTQYLVLPITGPGRPVVAAITGPRPFIAAVTGPPWTSYSCHNWSPHAISGPGREPIIAAINGPGLIVAAIIGPPPH